MQARHTAENQAGTQQTKKNSAAPGSSRANGFGRLAAGPVTTHAGTKPQSQPKKAPIKRAVLGGTGRFLRPPRSQTPKVCPRTKSRRLAWEGDRAVLKPPRSQPPDAPTPKPTARRKGGRDHLELLSAGRRVPLKPPLLLRCRLLRLDFLLHTLEHALGKFAAFLRSVRGKIFAATRFCM